MGKLTLYDLDLKGKRVLMRVDFNVPLSAEGTITDDTRIRQALPSIEYILSQEASLVLMSHLGRPKGARIDSLSLSPVAKRLAELLGRPVLMAPDPVGPKVSEMASHLQAGDILLLENLRFHNGEEHPESDPAFAKELASFGDCYVNDAFGTAHRNHASTCALAKHFPQAAASGFLMEKELSFFSNLITNPKRPFYAILGGAKISTKIGVIESLLSKIDALFIGGGMVFTFLKAQGISIGNSLCSDEHVETAKHLIKACSEKAIQLYLPKDFIIADAFSEDAHIEESHTIRDGWQGMDIGPKTVEEWRPILAKAATIFWNGPMGVFEMKPFARGTVQLAEIVSTLSCTTIVGGGDSVAAVNQAGLSKQFTHISTGGGASLEYIEFGHLPGIDALTEQ